MGKYSKAWGTLIGAALGLGAAYGVVPEGTDAAVSSAIDQLLPIGMAILGTIFSPKNA